MRNKHVDLDAVVGSWCAFALGESGRGLRWPCSSPVAVRFNCLNVKKKYRFYS